MAPQVIRQAWIAQKQKGGIVEDFLAGQRNVSNPAVRWEQSISLQNAGTDKDAVSLYAGKKEDKEEPDKHLDAEE